MDTDPDGYAESVNDLWARLPDGAQHVLDARVDIERANADYDERY